MRLHINVLGRLHQVWGAFGVMTGLSLAILAAGTRAAMAGEALGLGQRAAVVVLAGTGSVLLAGGGASVVIGSSLRRFSGRARHAALLVAVPNLLLVPFGTALAVYTFWVLLNDDARRACGRPPRAAEVPS